MVLDAYGLLGYGNDVLRGEINRLQGNDDPDEGTSLNAIASVARRAGLTPLDLFSVPETYKRWTVDDVRAHLSAGRPIITLVRFVDLPGNEQLDFVINHYIVLAGVSGDRFIYNDAAQPPGQGRDLLISPEALQRAWANSTIRNHAVAFALDAEGSGLLPSTSSDEDDSAGGPGDGLDTEGNALASEADLAMLANVSRVSAAPAAESGAVRTLAASDQQPRSSVVYLVALILMASLAAAALGVVVNMRSS
ncbi:MAG: Peptidase 2 protein [Chloroflexi bacterium]|nr:Peptidase 2 protein [Chloroflexota bacterium]